MKRSKAMKLSRWSSPRTQFQKDRDLVNLLNSAAAVVEDPECLTKEEKAFLIEDLLQAAIDISPHDLDPGILPPRQASGCSSGASLWTIDDLAAFLRLSRRAAYALSESSSIPRLYIGTRLRFFPEAVHGWLCANDRESEVSSYVPAPRPQPDEEL